MSEEDGIHQLNRSYSPALNLVPPNSKSKRYDDALAYFRTISWCADLLGVSGTYYFRPNCRNPASDHRDQFFSTTVATPTTLKHVLCFFATEDRDVLQDTSTPIAKVQTLYAPEDGLGGVGSMMHGGMIMALLDESSNVLLEINAVMNKQDTMFQAGSVTGGMEIKFMTPVLTRQTVLATANIDAVEGRKMRIKCDICDEDGIILAKASSTWFVVKHHLYGMNVFKEFPYNETE
ncbi:HotDog domain-containing protein [Trichoderma camerunense]